MNESFHYGIEECAQCGELVSANWEIRHLRSNCVGGSITLKQLVLAYRDGRLPSSVTVSAQPAQQTHSNGLAWARAAQVQHNVKFVWLLLDDYVGGYAAYNVDTRTLVLGNGFARAAVEEVTINE